MANVTVLAHLPRLRLSSDQFPLPFGWKLVKPTWESYDRVAGGRFQGWASKYEAADPVFLMVEEELDLDILQPGRATDWAELKVPGQWDELLPQMLGSTFLNFFHDRIADWIWAAFMLAVPGAGLGRPRSSLTMLIPGDDSSLRVAGQNVAGVRVQGEADQEYVFSADTACVPLTDDQVVSAIVLLESVELANKSDRLRPALRQLLSTSEPTLTSGDRLVLSVTALESLLLPDVQSGQQDAFASKLMELHGTESEPVARDLYRARSSAVHDGPTATRVSTIPPGQAEQILANTIVELAPASQELADLRAPGLDIKGSASPNKLLPRPAWFSAQLLQGSSMAPPDGYFASWSPLIGLTCGPDSRYRSRPECDLQPLSPREIVGMEEKDIRRDFIARFLLEEDLVACLNVVQRADPSLNIDDESMASALRIRDLTVAGLRIGGLHEFIDPELLGWYVYHHSLRFRRETVLRQTVLMKLGEPFKVDLTANVMEPVANAWRDLLAYDRAGAVDEIETALHLFRRGHDPFAPTETQAALLFCAVEGMLGRFRPHGARVQLEDLVSTLPAAHTDTEWFSSRARAMRIETAHGKYSGATGHAQSELGTLRRITAAAVGELIRNWIAADRGSSGRSPSAALVNSLQARLK